MERPQIILYFIPLNKPVHPFHLSSPYFGPSRFGYDLERSQFFGCNRAILEPLGLLFGSSATQLALVLKFQNFKTQSCL